MYIDIGYMRLSRVAKASFVVYTHVISWFEYRQKLQH